MAQQQDNALSNIRAYVNEARELQHGAMGFDASNIEARLEDTVKELQARVREQQDALEKLRSGSNANIADSAYPSNDPRQKLQQLLAIKAAYTSLKPTPTYLPSPGSVLPALLAARSLQQTVLGTKQAILSTQSQLHDAERALHREESQLHDATLLTRAMESRISRLRAQHTERSQKSPAQLARDLIASKRAQKDAYDTKMQELGTAMNDFINDYLAAMLAAEELGGPVVGDMLDVQDSVLAAGFTKKGKAKASTKPPSDKSRQKRIDQIWGRSATAGIEEDEDDEQPPTEAEAADAEMRKLIENLFATLVGPGGGKAYFLLERESAAARFLVRAKVAQFHGKDAKKLRLIDFGRELDD
ncbi:hypothetical protein BDU57DRAFT_544042 [Ampelomyces quisqualis]|uniref:Centromere protein Cenp-K n=1 Tax=Ampelomyces quisqualis TaxID=50730 RepID=A0A6A5R2K5_AMPQU|nr:hypothetical protein BDU57DRAFT_544042 [Ampelomyces quisqualis]